MVEHNSFLEDAMRRICLPIIIAISLLLSGCGRSEETKAAYDSFSQQLAASGSVSFTAALRAEYEHKTARFTLSYAEDVSGACVTVLSPQLIAGVSAHVRGGDTQLQYDGVMLATGELDGFGLSPMSALPELVSALKAGYLDSFWEEDGKTVYQLIPNDRLICTVWFEPGDMTPVRAELISEGRVTVYADISDWSAAD